MSERIIFFYYRFYFWIFVWVHKIFLLNSKYYVNYTIKREKILQLYEKMAILVKIFKKCYFSVTCQLQNDSLEKISCS